MGEGSIGAALGIGASVNEQNFHGDLLEMILNSYTVILFLA